MSSMGDTLRLARPVCVGDTALPNVPFRGIRHRLFLRQLQNLNNSLAKNSKLENEFD